MLISYWKCQYKYCKTWIDNDGEHYIFNCTFPNNKKGCLLNNKWDNKRYNCKLLDKEIKNEK